MKVLGKSVDGNLIVELDQSFREFVIALKMVMSRMPLMSQENADVMRPAGTDGAEVLSDLQKVETVMGTAPETPVVAEKPKAEKSKPGTLPDRMVKKLRTAVCEICGATYEKRTGIQKTCSEDCRKEKNLRYARNHHEKVRAPRREELGLTKGAKAARLERLRLVGRSLGIVEEDEPADGGEE